MFCHGAVAMTTVILSERSLYKSVRLTVRKEAGLKQNILTGLWRRTGPEKKNPIHFQTSADVQKLLWLFWFHFAVGLWVFTSRSWSII